MLSRISAITSAYRFAPCWAPVVEADAYRESCLAASTGVLRGKMKSFAAPAF